MRFDTKSLGSLQRAHQLVGLHRAQVKEEDQQAMVLEHLLGVDFRRELGEVDHLRLLVAAGGLRQLLHVFQAEVGDGLLNAIFGNAKIRLLQIRHGLAGFVVDAHIHQHLVGCGAQDEGLLRALGNRRGGLHLRKSRRVGKIAARQKAKGKDAKVRSPPSFCVLRILRL